MAKKMSKLRGVGDELTVDETGAMGRKNQRKCCATLAQFKKTSYLCTR
jgi:hypothetical protein